MGEHFRVPALGAGKKAVYALPLYVFLGRIACLLAIYSVLTRSSVSQNMTKGRYRNNAIDLGDLELAKGESHTLCYVMLRTKG